jgi:rhodanese-related sulfurtransferase
MIKNINPQQANEMLQREPGAVYIDVRTEYEFEGGHIPGAVNIPVATPDPATRKMVPNPDFLSVVEKNFNKNKKLIVGCQAGGRSRFAGEMMDQAGFTDISNMEGGFGGARDPMGRLVTPGWTQANLPIETEVVYERSYAGMKKT